MRWNKSAGIILKILKLFSIILFLLIFPISFHKVRPVEVFELGPVTNYTDTVPKASGRLCHVTTVQVVALKGLYLWRYAGGLSSGLKRFEQQFVFIEALM